MIITDNKINDRQGQTPCEYICPIYIYISIDPYPDRLHKKRFYIIAKNKKVQTIGLFEKFRCKNMIDGFWLEYFLVNICFLLPSYHINLFDLTLPSKNYLK